jgi:hypothetical protein
MGNPYSLTNGQNMLTDTPTGADGVGRFKLAVGGVSVTGTTDEAGWQGVATHEEGATPVAGDGVVAAAGYDLDNDLVVRVRVDSVGRLLVSSGSVRSGAKTMIAGARTPIVAGSLSCSGVLVKAYSDNEAIVYVGQSTVTADKAATGGFPLEPGESVGVPCLDAYDVNIIGTGTDGVAWLAGGD